MHSLLLVTGNYSKNNFNGCTNPYENVIDQNIIPLIVSSLCSDMLSLY